MVQPFFAPKISLPGRMPIFQGIITDAQEQSAGMEGLVVTPLTKRLTGVVFIPLHRL